MAKKKIKAEILPTVKTTNKNNVGSTGNVVLKICHNGKTIKTIKKHNTATFNLFRGFILMIRQDVSSFSLDNIIDFIPQFLSVGTDNSISEQGEYNRTGLAAEVVSFENNRQLLNVYGSIIKDTLNGVISTKYQTIIPYNKIAGFTIKELGLFGTIGTASLLARIPLNEDEWIELDSGYSLIVEWEIKIQNNLG